MSHGIIANTTEYLEVRTMDDGDEYIANFIVFGFVNAVQVRYLKLYSQFPIPERLKNKRRYPNTVSFRANCSTFLTRIFTRIFMNSPQPRSNLLPLLFPGCLSSHAILSNRSQQSIHPGNLLRIK